MTRTELSIEHRAGHTKLWWVVSQNSPCYLRFPPLLWSAGTWSCDNRGLTLEISPLSIIGIRIPWTGHAISPANQSQLQTKGESNDTRCATSHIGTSWNGMHDISIKKQLSHFLPVNWMPIGCKATVWKCCMFKMYQLLVGLQGSQLSIEELRR